MSRTCPIPPNSGTKPLPLAAAGRCVRGAPRSGFSLLELTVAIAILGLGLVMVATMFPVAWSRARKLNEVTTQRAATQSAELIMGQIMRVDDAVLEANAGSFAGDLIHNDTNVLGGGGPPPDHPLAAPDTRVHALYLENIRVSAPRSFIPNREAPLLSAGAPWRLEQMLNALSVNPDDLPVDHYFFTEAFGGPQVRFEQRVYPPLKPRAVDTVGPTGEFTDPDPQWDEALDTRRYAWTVFHRLRVIHTDDPAVELERYDNLLDIISDPKNAVTRPREFDVYYVTLTRPQPTHRYAQQDPDPNLAPCPFRNVPGKSPRRGEPKAPAALAPEDDVLLPVPWRVQVYFPDTLALGDEDDPPTGVPTEIEVNTANVPTAAFVVDFFQPGTPFIDEANGQVYRVVQRRLAGDEDEQAYLTLDREVLLGEIDDGYYDPDPADNHFDNKMLEADELVRTVWVFPPPVQAIRLRDGVPVFEGKQPVVGIEVRRMVMEPPGTP